MSENRIVVLGVTGMLGHKVFQRLRASMEGVTGLARGNPEADPIAAIPLLAGPDVLWGVDVEDLSALAQQLEALRPRVLVNCIGIVKQRSEAKVAVPSILVNSLLPHWLAERLSGWGGRVIHFSTDCVFSGRKGLYTEADLPDAEDLYGRTKALGEVAVENALTLRTSIIGRELRGRRSLIEWFLSQRGGRVSGYRHVIYSGVTTSTMAALVELLIRDHPRLSGLHHVTAEPISKLELLRLVNEAFRTRIEIEPDDKAVLDRSMRSDAFRKAVGWAPPPWEAMIAHMASDSTPYETWQSLAERPGAVARV